MRRRICDDACSSDTDTTHDSSKKGLNLILILRGKRKSPRPPQLLSLSRDVQIFCFCLFSVFVGSTGGGRARGGYFVVGACPREPRAPRNLTKNEKKKLHNSNYFTPPTTINISVVLTSYVAVFQRWSHSNI